MLTGETADKITMIRYNNNNEISELNQNPGVQAVVIWNVNIHRQIGRPMERRHQIDDM